MPTQEFNLKDKSLYYLNTTDYQNSLVSGRYAKDFQWVKNRPELPTYYTYTDLDSIGDEEEKNCILMESSSIIPNHVAWVYQNRKMFNIIYTHNSDLLKNCDNARWIPGGGIWIGTTWGGGEIELYNKTKFCSFVSSDKQMCALHRTRLSAFRYFQSQGNIDMYGTAAGTGFCKAIDYLRDYMFTIVFENNVDDMYFTEKLLNCFAAGTIPIYLGARKISERFNAKGIFQFKDMSELMRLMAQLTETAYFNRIDAVRDNFERCQQYACTEDYMWVNYMKEQYERRDSA